MNPRVADLLERVKKKRSYIHDRFNAGRAQGCRPSDVRNVLIIDSASRSGSSFLYFLLSSHPDVLSLNGEESLFERLHGVGIAQKPGDSDHIARDSGVPDETIARVAEDILRDAGSLRWSEAGGAFPRESFIADSAQRLLLQYPEIDFDPEQLHRLCSESLGPMSGGGALFSSRDYWLRLLENLSRASFPVDAGHYDLLQKNGAAPSDKPAPGLAAAAPVAHPPPPFSLYALEDPPFVVPEPRAFPSANGLGAKTLLLKSPSHCYRMWMVRKMFPKARFKFVVLARNPAATVSSLMDGWLSRGFQSHNMEEIAPLDIKGYTRADLAWTRQWWKFDLPPGWADYRAKPLAEVCGLQWLSANEHIRKDIAEKVVEDFIDVRYEALLDRVLLAKELDRVCDFAGIENSFSRSADASRPVMSVTPPAPGKWRKRKDILAPVVSDGKIANMAKALGYAPKDWENWA